MIDYSKIGTDLKHDGIKKYTLIELISNNIEN